MGQVCSSADPPPSSAAQPAQALEPVGNAAEPPPEKAKVEPEPVAKDDAPVIEDSAVSQQKPQAVQQEVLAEEDVAANETDVQQSKEGDAEVTMEEADAINNGEDEAAKVELDDDAPKTYNPDRRRGSVSAEVANAAMGRVELVKVFKTDEQRDRIREAIKHSFLFSELEEEQSEDVIETMVEHTVQAGDEVITEGGEGDNYYIIELGTFEAYKDGELKFTYEGHGAFGELALMYNSPRQATVKAISEGTLWAVDRQTFRAVILTSMQQKREMYEQILGGMDLFSELAPEARSTIADCLTSASMEPGMTVLTEGDAVDSDARFYIVESGIVECFKDFNGEQQLVKTVDAGGVFGEYGLISHVPRQATVVVKEKAKILSLGRDAFERLMGPIEDILSKKIEEYEKFNEEALAQHV